MMSARKVPGAPFLIVHLDNNDIFENFPKNFLMGICKYLAYLVESDVKLAQKYL